MCNGSVWVNCGCWGEFVEVCGNSGGGWGGGDSNYSVICSSNNNC